MTKQSTSLSAIVEKYNIVALLSSKYIAKIDKDRVARGHFTWNAEKGTFYFYVVFNMN